MVRAQNYFLGARVKPILQVTVQYIRGHDENDTVINNDVTRGTKGTLESYPCTAPYLKR